MWAKIGNACSAFVIPCTTQPSHLRCCTTDLRSPLSSAITRAVRKFGSFTGVMVIRARRHRVSSTNTATELDPFSAGKFHECGVRLRSGTSISPSVFLMGCLLRNLVRVQTSGPIPAEWICDMPEAASSRTTCTMAPSIR